MGCEMTQIEIPEAIREEKEFYKGLEKCLEIAKRAENTAEMITTGIAKWYSRSKGHGRVFFKADFEEECGFFGFCEDEKQAEEHAIVVGGRRFNEFSYNIRVTDKLDRILGSLRFEDEEGYKRKPELVKEIGPKTAKTKIEIPSLRNAVYIKQFLEYIGGRMGLDTQLKLLFGAIVTGAYTPEEVRMVYAGDDIIVYLDTLDTKKPLPEIAEINIQEQLYVVTTKDRKINEMTRNALYDKLGIEEKR